MRWTALSDLPAEVKRTDSISRHPVNRVVSHSRPSHTDLSRSPHRTPPAPTRLCPRDSDSGSRGRSPIDPTNPSFACGLLDRALRSPAPQSPWSSSSRVSTGRGGRICWARIGLLPSRARICGRANGHKQVPRKEGRKATGPGKAEVGDEKQWKSGSVVVGMFDLGLGLSAEEEMKQGDWVGLSIRCWERRSHRWIGRR